MALEVLTREGMFGMLPARARVPSDCSAARERTNFDGFQSVVVTAIDPRGPRDGKPRIVIVANPAKSRVLLKLALTQTTDARHVQHFFNSY